MLEKGMRVKLISGRDSPFSPVWGMSQGYVLGSIYRKNDEGNFKVYWDNGNHEWYSPDKLAPGEKPPRKTFKKFINIRFDISRTKVFPTRGLSSLLKSCYNSLSPIQKKKIKALHWVPSNSYEVPSGILETEYAPGSLIIFNDAISENAKSTTCRRMLHFPNLKPFIAHLYAPSDRYKRMPFNRNYRIISDLGGNSIAEVNNNNLLILFKTDFKNKKKFKIILDYILKKFLSSPAKKKSNIGALSRALSKKYSEESAKTIKSNYCRIANFKEEIKEYRNKVKSLKASTVILEAGKINPESFEKEIKKLLKEKNILDIRANIAENTIYLKTRDIILDEKFNIGKYLISLCWDDEENSNVIRVFNEHLYQKNAYQHPHIDSDGECCFGGIDTDICTAFDEGRIKELINLLITYLSFTNEDDTHIDRSDFLLSLPIIFKGAIDEEDED